MSDVFLYNYKLKLKVAYPPNNLGLDRVSIK